MTISGSLLNAYSGLTAAARAAETVAQNVANVATDGYGRREIELQSASVGGRGAGVRVTGVFRRVDMGLIAARQQADAQSGSASLRATAFARIESNLGVPGQAGSLSDGITRLETALASAGSRPDLPVRQQTVLYAARDLVALVNGLSDDTQSMRVEADDDIAESVANLNQGLSDIQRLNQDIRLQIGAGRDPNGLLDQRQVLVDRIAALVPLKTLQRDNGQIALISTSGAVLLDGSAAVFDFTATRQITPDMTLASGALSGLTMNGKPATIGGAGLLEGGTLAALFTIRDQIAPNASAQIDAFARNLIERFEDPAIDPTVLAGAPGLFTDAGAALDTGLEVGLAQRLSLNSAVDPDQGGLLSRLRDGLGAVTTGDVGDASILAAFSDALATGRATLSGSSADRVLSAAELANAITSENGAARLDADEKQSFAAGRAQEFRASELEGGVDTDQEMQNLLLVEKSYAANARVISTADQMLQTLLEL